MRDLQGPGGAVIGIAEGIVGLLRLETGISEFCRSTYGINFPMFAKITVTGPDNHPLYEALIEAAPKAEFKPGSMLLKRLIHAARRQGELLWNFEKFLIDRNGAVIKRFAPDTKPEDETIVRAIEAALTAA